MSHFSFFFRFLLGLWDLRKGWEPLMDEGSAGEQRQLLFLCCSASDRRLLAPSIKHKCHSQYLSNSQRLCTSADSCWRDEWLHQEEHKCWPAVLGGPHVHEQRLHSWTVSKITCSLLRVRWTQLLGDLTNTLKFLFRTRSRGALNCVTAQ